MSSLQLYENDAMKYFMINGTTADYFSELWLDASLNSTITHFKFVQKKKTLLWWIILNTYKMRSDNYSTVYYYI